MKKKDCKRCKPWLILTESQQTTASFMVLLRMSSLYVSKYVRLQSGLLEVPGSDQVNKSEGNIL